MATQSKRPPFAWVQPCCSECWTSLKLKTGQVNEEAKRKHHFCCFCRADIPVGTITHLIRLNPGTVPYPTMRKVEE